MGLKDYYRILNLPTTANLTEIKKSYRSLALSLHPDMTHGDKAKESRFKEVNEAFETLSCAALRIEYDRSRGYTDSSSFQDSATFRRRPDSSQTDYQPQARPVQSVDPSHFDVGVWNAWHYGNKVWLTISKMCVCV
jgi:curved DNA-binding protein CbpA